MHHVSNQCAYSDDDLYPREYGGNLGGTQVLCFDIKVNNSYGTLAIGGTSASQDIVTHVNSGFITYENVLDYQMLWAKELYLTNYATQVISVVDVKINYQSSYVFAGIQSPLVLLKLLAADGSIVDSRVLTIGGTYSSASQTLWNIGYNHQWNSFVAYFTDTSNYDYLLFFSSLDFTSSVNAFQLFNGLTSFQAKKKMSYQYNAYKGTLQADVSGFVPYLGTSIAMRQTINYNGATFTSQLEYQLAFWEDIYVFALGSTVTDFLRIACIAGNSDLYYSGQYINLLVENSASSNLYYLYPTPLVSTSKVKCRNVVVTNDMRPFIFIDTYDSLAPTSSSYQPSILEITGGIGGTITIQTTYLQSYSTSFGSYMMTSFFNIFNDVSTGQNWLLYSYNGNQFNGKSRSNNNGFLMKAILDVAGALPVTPTLNCGITPTTSFTQTFAGTVIAWLAIAPAVVSMPTYQISPDSLTQASLNLQDLSQYQIFESGCSVVPASTIPKYVPYIAGPIYYVIGVDNLVTSGIKQFSVTPNVSMATLTQCQLQAVAYEFRMQSNLAIPSFLSFDRTTFHISVNNPVAGASPSQTGAFPLQIIIRDIFGDTSVFDITLYVILMTTTPVGIQNCYAASQIVTQPFVFDTLYVIGTLKHVKIQMAPPMTSLGDDCSNLVEFQASLLSGGLYVSLPYFITLDTVNRRFVIQLSSTNGMQYVNKLYRVVVDAYIPGQEGYAKQDSFKVALVASQQKNCIYYYQMNAPVIPDIVTQTNYISPFSPFQISGATCNQLPIQLQALQSNGNGLPTTYITVDLINSKIIIDASLYSGPLPVTYSVRLDAWVQDPVLGIRALQNKQEFTITIVGQTQCIGSVILNIDVSSKYYITRYTNIDAPTALSEQFQDSLAIVKTYYQAIPLPLTCDSATQTYSVGLYQDYEFPSVTWASQIPALSIPSYSIPLASMITSNVGLYDIRMTAKYVSSPSLTSPYYNIQAAYVYLQYHMYQASLCQFTVSNQPIIVQYSIMRVAQTLVVGLSSFQMITDGCIYDTFQYEFTNWPTFSLLPNFIKQNPFNISVSISTSNSTYAGTYNIQLTGSLNPYLTLSIPITIVAIVFQYPNTGAPNFQGTVLSPLVLTLGKQRKYTLPNIRDPDGDSFFVEIEYIPAVPLPNQPLGVLPNFITFNSAYKEFTFQPNNQSDVGTYQFMIKLTDTNAKPLSRNVPMTIIVKQFDSSQIFGLQNMIKPEYIGVQSLGISQDGLLILAFNMSLFNQYAGPAQFNNQSISLQFKKAFTQQSVQIPWTLQNITRNELYIQLNFSDPATISMFSEKDQLVVKFNKSTPLLESQINQTGIALAQYLSFLASNTSSPANFSVSIYQLSQNVILKNPVPKQTVAQSQFESLFGSIFPYLAASATLLLVGNLVLNIILQVFINNFVDRPHCKCCGVLLTLFNLLFSQLISALTSRIMQCS